ncbi:MAG TPA: hypothetical protein VKS01_07580 [Bryobacteraceae bacterium]|nr:hypothetical protein [Bryobacteraceae bacterium]
MVAASLAAVLLAPACRTKRPRVRVVEEDSSAQTAGILNMADPRSASQLVRGFYSVENGAWRWAMKNFAVTLRPPAGAAQLGAKLELKFSIPDVVFKDTGAQTIRAKVNGVELPAQKYASSGDATYTQDVPASALSGDTASVEFTAEKALAPSARDARELAVIVTSVALLPK